MLLAVEAIEGGWDLGGHLQEVYALNLVELVFGGDMEFLGLVLLFEVCFIDFPEDAVVLFGVALFQGER